MDGKGYVTNHYSLQMIQALEELVRFDSVKSEAKTGAPYGEEMIDVADHLDVERWITKNLS